MRVFILCRHGESELNVLQRVNGDPSVSVALTETGVAQARELRTQLAGLPLDAVVHTRFGRTQATAGLVLGDRTLPAYVEPLLDDIDVGELEGLSLEDYRAWKRARARADPFPGGESLDEAAQRYARGLRALLTLHGSCVLVVCHEIPIRYAVNAAAGSNELEYPAHSIGNCVPYPFSEDALERAAERIEALL